MDSLDINDTGNIPLCYMKPKGKKDINDIQLDNVLDQL